MTDVAVNGSATACAGSSVQLTATSATVSSPVFTWYSNANLTTAVFTGPVFDTPVLNTNATYYVTVKGGNKCENTATTARVVTVQVNGGSTASDIVLSGATTICSGTSVSLSATSINITNPVFTWYTDANLTTAVFTGPAFTTPALSANTNYYVTVKGANKCENTPANAKVAAITVTPPAGMTDVAVNGSATACAGSSVQLTATSATVSSPVFTWYSNANLTTAVFTGPVFNTPVLNTNTNYYVTVKGDNKCENIPGNAKVLMIAVIQRPSAPTFSPVGRNICSGQVTNLIISNPQAGTTYLWYTVASGGLPVFTGNAFTTPVLNTNTNYYVQAIGASGCTNPEGRAVVAVSVSSRPTLPTVMSNNINVCSGSVAILAVASPISTQTYSWYTTATGGMPIGNGTNFSTPPVTSNVTYFVEAAAGSCQSLGRTPVAVVALPAPSAPTVITSSASAICAGSTVVLTVNNPDPNLNYHWFDSSSSGSRLAEGITFTTPALNTATSYFVQAVTRTGGCTSLTRTQVPVNTLPLLGTPQVIVAASSSKSITFAWDVIAGATSYEISLDNGATWNTPGGGSNGITHTVSNLQPAQSITLAARAKGSLICQTSNYSSVGGTTTNPFSNDLFIPNTFTPTGDGKNDMFLAYGNTISKLRMQIYNQWGILLFESNSPAIGWDGGWKGSLQPSGVYVYYIDASFNDGTTKLFKGTVTLIR